MWGVPAPAHAELDPSAADPVIGPLACALVEQAGTVRFEPGSRLLAIYGSDDAVEGYHCSYGLNPAARHGWPAVPASGRRELAGDVRAVELDGHPFFIGTLYQPERSALDGRGHPLIAAFVEAATRRSRAVR